MFFLQFSLPKKQHWQPNTNTFTADKPWFGHMTVLPVFQVLAVSHLIIRDSLTRSFTLFRKGALAKTLVEAVVHNKSHTAELRLAVLLTVLPNKSFHINNLSLASLCEYCEEFSDPQCVRNTGLNVYSQMNEIFFLHDDWKRNYTGINCTNYESFCVNMIECFRYSALNFKSCNSNNNPV